ncbi:hypothetical protein [Pedobacter sp. MW01-1-1]|uniref:hypothetical protein n=1 Tax=Pedobacter sp. MW01-1-1 TaxID=3383027 RepID=UPI003FEDFD70
MNTSTSQLTLNESYDYAANLLVMEKYSPSRAIAALINQGINQSDADEVVSNVELQIKQASQTKAKKDVFYGGLFLIAGAAATLADIGFFFWGAILYGGYQFITGIVDSHKTK